MNKYRNKKCEYLGFKFDSQKEMARYKELLLLEKAGQIIELELQVKFELNVNKIKICTYIADFAYFDSIMTNRYVEDVKSEITRKLPVYRIKKKLMRAIWGIEIIET